MKAVIINPLNANPKKWSNTLKQFVGKLPTNYLIVCDHFVGLALNWITLTLVAKESHIITNVVFRTLINI